MTEFHGNEKIGSFGLDEKGEDDEFTLTKLFDIHLKGGYENLHPDLKEVIRSQLQPELKDKLEEHLSTDNSLLEKLENFTESQRSYNIDFTANCKYLVGIDKQSLFCDIPENTKRVLPKSCREIQRNGHNVSGIYEIQPKMSKKPFMVLCDMETMGGGWTHIQRRLDGSQDFFLGWREYKFGFGNLNGEFWMGLENIYISTGYEANELLVEIVDRDNVKALAHYKAFAVGSEKEGYPLSTLRDCTGDAGDALTHHLGSKFTTKDFDQDSNPSNCAIAYSGAWWYKSCHLSNLNGKYLNANLPEQYKFHGVHWNTFRSHEYCHARARMLIRPAV
ncbi:microfibril-associated glycoprotein 4-like isoform X2 [Leptinotarsa decemlineata]|uniref:microfibril-associated glycoprotein 4-like isoform X2 n=1 Tax=Leptinotarsa decemlineata TaxID=7539 RepID=UPI003D3090EB